MIQWLFVLFFLFSLLHSMIIFINDMIGVICSIVLVINVSIGVVISIVLCVGI